MAGKKTLGRLRLAVEVLSHLDETGTAIKVPQEFMSRAGIGPLAYCCCYLAAKLRMAAAGWRSILGESSMKAEYILAMVMLAGATARAAEVNGEVKVTGRSGSVPTYIYAEPLDSGIAVTPGHFTMKQVNKQLVPHVLVVPLGSAVDFTNEDPILHNIFSKTKPGGFDLGLYKKSKPVLFRYANTYRVFCNIHPEMTAVILVVPTSYIAEVDSSGHYRLELPAGRYRVTAWSERAATPVTAEIVVSSGIASVPLLAIDESKYVELPHKNKFGRDYNEAEPNYY
jgi:plastocyanin